jgi:hypothetical protein
MRTTLLSPELCKSRKVSAVGGVDCEVFSDSRLQKQLIGQLIPPAIGCSLSIPIHPMQLGDQAIVTRIFIEQQPPGVQ